MAKRKTATRGPKPVASADGLKPLREAPGERFPPKPKGPRVPFSSTDVSEHGIGTVAGYWQDGVMHITHQHWQPAEDKEGAVVLPESHNAKCRAIAAKRGRSPGGLLTELVDRAWMLEAVPRGRR